MTELRKYNAAATVLFPLVSRGLADLDTTATFAAGDVKLIKDEGAAANTTNLPVHEGNGIYSVALTATELSCARAGITIVDQTAPKVWEDQALIIDTYGDAAAQHELDLDAPFTAIADAILARPISSVEPGAAFRTLYGAIAALVNRRRISGTNLEVYKTNDSTVLSTIPITTTPGQQPVTELDPP